MKKTQESKRRHARRIYRLPSPMSRALNRTRKRRTLPKVSKSHPPLEVNPSASFSEPSWRHGIPDFLLVSEKGDDASVCDSQRFAEGRICTVIASGRYDRIVETTANSLHGTTEFIQGFE